MFGAPNWTPRALPGSSGYRRLRHPGRVDRPIGATSRLKKRLSYLSSVLPWGFRPDDCIEDAEKAPHASDERDLLWPSAFNEAFIVLADDWVPTCCGQGRHIESITDDGTAAGDCSPAAHVSRIAID